jgi:uncharacterized protein
MTHETHAFRLDVQSFARTAGRAAAGDLLSKYERLMHETKGLGGNELVNWTAQGEMRQAPGGEEQPWLHLEVDATVPLTCQRCLGPVNVPVKVSRSFRFVASEEEAERQDEEAEEDVLALDRDFDLRQLIEDEVLMELPVVPRHDTCPTDVKLAVEDSDFGEKMAEKPNPFAVLEQLKGGKPN